MKKYKIIRTSNKEIYEKFNMLNFSSEIILKNVRLDNRQLNRILKNINGTEEILESVGIGDMLLIRKKAPVNFRIYPKKGVF